MSAKRRTEGDRQALARAWIEAKKQGVSQTEFASRHGISPRTLRSFLARQAVTSPPAEVMRQILDQLEITVAALKSRLDTDSATVESDPEPRPSDPHAPEDTTEAASGPPAAAIVEVNAPLPVAATRQSPSRVQCDRDQPLVAAKPNGSHSAQSLDSAGGVPATKETEDAAPAKPPVTKFTWD